MAMSQMGRCVSRANLSERDILIAYKIFFDSSGKENDGFMTIGAVAANDELWSKFESDWSRILKSRSPVAEYVHMNEILIGDKGFSYKLGWDQEKAFQLAGKCVLYMSRLDKEKFRMFHCSVDLSARRKLIQQEHPIPEPVALLTEFVHCGIMGWYLNYLGKEVLDLGTDSMHFIFDQGEPFEGPFKEKWHEGLKRFGDTGVVNEWILVESVGEAVMRKTPGIQAADILAWSVNREKTSPEGYPGSKYLEIIKTVIPTTSLLWDESRMLKCYGKDLGKNENR